MGKFSLIAFLLSFIIFVTGLINPKYLSKIKVKKIIHAVFLSFAMLIFSILAYPGDINKTSSSEVEGIIEIQAPTSTLIKAPTKISAIPVKEKSAKKLTLTPTEKPKPTLTPTKIPPTPTEVVLPTNTPEPTKIVEFFSPPTQPPNTGGGSYTCDCNKTCPNLSCDEAYYQLNACGCTERDGNNDGIPCNAQCR